MSAKIKVIDRELKKLDPSFRRAQKGTKNLGSTFKSGALQAVALGTGVGAAALGVSKLIGVVSSGIRSFAAFEQSMVRIETLVGLSREEVEGMTGALREISLATGRGPQELSEALFQITSAGLSGKEALDTLNASAKASAVGLGDVATIADIATSAMNAYGSENITAEKAVGVLLKAVREGKASPAELAASMGKLIPITATMGVEFSEATGIVASMTRVGFSASEGVTALRGAMLTILNPTEQARKTLEEVGLSMVDIRKALDEGGVLAALQLLREQLDDTQLSKFISKEEAFAGVLSVTGDRFQETADIVKSTAETLGVIDDAFERTADTAALQAARVGQAWQEAKDSIGGAAISIADALLKIKGGGFIGVAADVLGIDFTSIEEARKAMDDVRNSTEELAASQRLIAQIKAPQTALFGKIDAEVARRSAVAAKEAAAAAKLKEKADKTAASAAAAHAKEIDRLAESLGKGGLNKELDNMVEGLARLSDANRELSTGGGQQVVDLVDELRENMIPVPPLLAEIAFRTRAMNVEFKNLASITPELGKDFEDLVKNETLSQFEQFNTEIGLLPNGIGDGVDATVDFSAVVGDLAHQFQILGIDANSSLGSMIANFSTLAAQIPQLQKDLKAGNLVGGAIGKGDFAGAAGGVATGIGAIASATASGSTGARTGKGALAGASAGAQVGGPIGAIVGAAAGAITGFLRGRSAAKALKNIQNEVGVKVSEGMLNAIRDSGRPAQLMIAEIFAEGIAAGTANVDDLAREMGDVFSHIEFGGITEAEGIKALEQSLPLLLQNLQDLGPAGEAEIDRIIAAADRLGIEFDGLSDLINSTFAPQTLEEMKESLGLTGEEVRALAETLGVDLQTNLERAATAAGLTVEEFKALQEAAGAALGSDTAATMEQLAALMEATGLSAQELAERLGVDAAGGAGSVAEEVAKGTAEISAAADQAGRLTEQLLSAARAASGISIPSGVGGDGGALPPGLAHGGFVRANPPFGTTVRLGEREDEFAIPRSKLGGSAGAGGGTVIQKVEVNLSVQGNILSTEEEIAAAIEGPISRLVLQSPEIQDRIREVSE